MLIYYFNSSFHVAYAPLDKEVIANQQADYSGNYAYLLNEEEMTFKEKYPEATIQNIFSRSVPNEYTERLRQDAYKAESDSLFIAWQKYLAQNKESQALAMKQAWLDKVAEIEARYPYFFEVNE